MNFIDATLNLTRNSYAPFTKPGNTIVYVHASSNPPPTITKNITLVINEEIIRAVKWWESVQQCKM